MDALYNDLEVCDLDLLVNEIGLWLEDPEVVPFDGPHESAYLRPKSMDTNHRQSSDVGVLMNSDRKF